MESFVGGCFCGQVRYEFPVNTPVLLSAYCHCSNCQRLTAGTAVHSIHLAGDSLRISGDVQTFHLFSKTNKYRKRCVTCGTQVASWNADKFKWSVWASTLDRDEQGRIPQALAAQHHMFYETRRLNAADNLPKWVCYPGESERLA